MRSQSSGCKVFRVDGPFVSFVKIAPRTTAGDLRFHPEEEGRRLRWLTEQGIPVPELLEVGEAENEGWMITRGVEGRPASAPWCRDEQTRVIESLSETVRQLHRLSVESCPFSGRLSQTLQWAETATNFGWVDTDDLDEEHRGWTAAALLRKLRATPAPAEDLVVCHGDPYLDNILIDPQTLRVTALLDVGRVGVADRWRDLSVLIRSVRDGEPEQTNGNEWAQTLLNRYGTLLDQRKLDFYQLVDEFF